MGGAPKGAQRAAEAAEKERLNAIRASQSKVNALFDSPDRQADINDVIAATRQFNIGELNREREKASRTSRFALARSGLTGGSQAVDVNSDIASNFLRGVLQAERTAQDAGSRLRLSDEESRQNLLALSQSGLDATTGAQRAGASLANNLDAAKNGRLLSDFSNLFGSISQVQEASQQAQQRRRGFNDALTRFKG